MSVQPDLFGDYDRAEADRRPQTCPHCGTVEPNGFLLRNNHWPDPNKACPNISSVAGRWASTLTRSSPRLKPVHTEPPSRFPREGRIRYEHNPRSCGGTPAAGHRSPVFFPPAAMSVPSSSPRTPKATTKATRIGGGQ